MLNKNAFILYDALLSFMLLSSMILLFNKLLVVDIKNRQKVTEDINGINYLREGIYNKYEIIKNDEYETILKGDEYCVVSHKNSKTIMCVKR